MPKSSSSNQLEFWEIMSPASSRQEMLFSGDQLDALSHRRTTFADKPTPATTTKLMDARFAERRPLNILVADDNEVNRKVIRIILQKLGYSCVEATNGVEAFKRYKDGGYDYVFMDLDMPEMDGIEAAQAIRQSEGDVKKAEIIAVTANVSDEMRLKCRRVGMNGYLEKPITAAIIKDQLLRSWPRVRSRRGKTLDQ